MSARDAAAQSPPPFNSSCEVSSRPYEADSAWNYELGFKSRWLDDRFGLDLAAFRIDWDGMQVTGVSRTNAAVRFIANAGAARIDGIELEATVLPLDGLQVSLAGSYLDAKL